MTDKTPTRKATNASVSRAPTDSVEVRDRLEEALRLNLIGPEPGHELADEEIRGWTRPSSWYLTGFLVPRQAASKARSDAEAEDDLGAEVPATGGLAEESAEDLKAAKRTFFPSSMGLSFLVPGDAREIGLTVSWGDYERAKSARATGESGRPLDVWRRTPCRTTLTARIGSGPETLPLDVPDSGGLQLHIVEPPQSGHSLGPRIPAETRAISLFLVNERPPPEEDQAGTADIFQAQIGVRCDAGFVGRPDPRASRTDAWDDEVADLHFADTPDYATGHGVSADWDIGEDGTCRDIRTEWIPRAEVEKIETAEIPGANLSMRALGSAADGEEVERMLRPIVREYRSWIAEREADLTQQAEQHRETASELLRLAGLAVSRIERGIGVLVSDADAFDAFRVANRAVARALRKRNELDDPKWRAFQIAFILLNLPGLADPTDPDREIAELLFFPTGGGKTEAYLGLAAFVMVLRRLRNPAAGARAGAGVSVIMRYTLRLLTFDQLGRAAGLVCALELERERNPERYGEWPFEIGLWVGKAATPNVMGRSGDTRRDSARLRTIRFRSDPTGNPPPIPLAECPWCGEDFKPASFRLTPDANRPTDLRVGCVNPDCDFTRDRALPIVAVDEPLYRRLPAFLIATVDKFASLPWVGESGALLRGADRWDPRGFYGPATPGRGRRLPRPLPPPDLIVQDELHLITGPLGTMTGLYEAAIDSLATRVVEGQRVRPKIVASTATANRSQDQVQAIFGRALTAVFPPTGLDRRDSFFARTRRATEIPARRYLGITAPGRNPKAVMQRVMLTLAGAAQRAYNEACGKGNTNNPADPYMTVLSYFNALRELGGGRRIIEEEVQSLLGHYGGRRRIGERRGLFHDRKAASEVMELTSRVPTDKVAEARRRLGIRFGEPGSVAWAIATNMISVGLDIQRLGLMLVIGQPKTHAEYIQATSRVGRDDGRPGLVVTLLNIHKPRDRSHYERFRHYHETFYRSVEAASVTPFSARALDRGFAGAFVSFARHHEALLTPPSGAGRIADCRRALEREASARFLERVDEQPLFDQDDREERKRSVQMRSLELLDAWERIRALLERTGTSLVYQPNETGSGAELLREMLDSDQDLHDAFRMGRSLRDVEPEVWLRVKESSL